jgi:hypothetical protein
MDMKNKWKYFLKNIQNESLEFEIVIGDIRQFLEPVYGAMVEGTEWQRVWDCKETSWISMCL